MVISDAVIEADCNFIERLGDLSDPTGFDITPIGNDIGSEPSALGITGDFYQVAAVEWFAAGKDEGPDANFNRLVHQVTSLRRRQFATSCNGSVLITVGATEVTSLRADPVYC
jgi:hypothetical protein